jgi:hypothetical protein
MLKEAAVFLQTVTRMLNLPMPHSDGKEVHNPKTLEVISLLASKVS